MALTDYVIMPAADYQNICDSVRAKTGKTDVLKSGDVSTEIDSIQMGGGGSIDGVHTVTFMSEDGTVTLYERYVVDGDDCADVVDRGLIDAPTKESTAQYDFSHSGWSLTSGGAAETDALSAVTADRTVYAAFDGTVRHYTVTYYDSDGTTVLKTESLAYGSMPSSSYAPEKDEYIFNGWEPELITVTGDASYTALWIEKVGFAAGTWDEIIATANSGNAANAFAIGDERTETIEIDGVSEPITYVVAGFGVSTLADGTTKDNMSIITKHALSKTRAMHSTAYSGNYIDTDLAKWLNDDLFSCLPEALQNGIKSKAVYYDSSAKSFTGHKCWLISKAEMNLDTGNSYVGDYDFAIGKQFPIFTNDATSRIKTLGENGEATVWWARAYVWSGNKTKFCTISANGTCPTTETGLASANNEKGVVFGFCI